MKLLEVKNLHKKFGKRVVLDGVSFYVKKGEIFGLLGENGAGKTTLLLILSTLLKKDKGSIALDGIEIDKNPEKFRKAIAIVFQDPSFDEEMTAYDNLKLFAELLGISKEEMGKKIDNVLSYFSLLERKHDVVKIFSIGMKRKLSLARAMLKEPRIMILDEPSSNLDYIARKNLWSYIKKMKKHGITFIIATHQADEAMGCDRIAIIHKGKILFVAKPQNLKKLAEKKNIAEAVMWYIKKHGKK
jgi:ABC-2 type transport system ATP-binding protein